MSPARVPEEATRGHVIPIGGAEDKARDSEILRRFVKLAGRDRVLSDRPYASTLSHIAPRKLATLSRWSVGFLLSLVALLAISEMLWVWQSWPVRHVLQTGKLAPSEASK